MAIANAHMKTQGEKRIRRRSVSAKKSSRGSHAKKASAFADLQSPIEILAVPDLRQTFWLSRIVALGIIRVTSTVGSQRFLQRSSVVRLPSDNRRGGGARLREFGRAKRVGGPTRW